MTPELDVLVVGAGPVGLTLACQLTRLGLQVRLIEKRSGPSIHSKAIGLQYRVSEVLARMGLVNRFLAEGGSPTTVNIHSGDRRLVTLRFEAPAGVSGREAFRPQAILIAQSRTEQLLVDHLGELGGRVEWDTELLDHVQSGERVSAQVRSANAAHTIVAKWLVSCEGAHSVVRKQAGIPFRGKTYPLAFVMADVRMRSALPHSENHVWLHEDGSLAVLPLPPQDTWRLFVEVTANGQGPPSTPSLADVMRIVATRAPSLDAQLLGDALWLSEFRINCRMVDRLHDGRVFLAGDAAHLHSPTGGQGITTGVQDATNLAWKLARVIGGAPARLLDTYAEERLPHAEEVLRETDRTTTILFAPTRPLRFVRDVFILPVLRNAWVQRRMFGKLSQLHVHYRRGSLSVEEIRRPWTKRRVIRAGDRAPDVAFTDTSGASTTLFALLAPLRPVLLCSAAAEFAGLRERLRNLQIDVYAVETARSVPDGPVPALSDVTGDFARLYGLRRDFLCLIRPDGHVGLVQIPPSRPGLVRYLRLICDPDRVHRAFDGSGSGWEQQGSPA